MIDHKHRWVTPAAVALISMLGLSACSQEAASTADEAQSDEGQQESGDAQADTEGDTEQEAIDPAERTSQEAAGPQPRLAVTSESGVAVVDGSTLEVLDDFDAEGFLRVNPAGDGRHFFVSEGESFRLLDAGTWAEPHGEHNHYYTTEPLLTDITVEGPEPGHVVAHDGIGALFFDGNGEIHTFDLTDLDAEAELDTEVAETEEAHHGVAVMFGDGSRFETLGDADSQPGARIVDSAGEETARNEDCPGVHGEAAGANGEVAVGCEDGALVWDGEQFTKIDAGPDFARTGNLFPHADSGIMLGDYREDEETPMTEVALIDVDSGELQTADVGSAYNFRSLARGPEAEALVLAEDGQLHVLDPESGDHIEALQVIDEWTEPDEWQQPRPAIQVIGTIAYVTDPAEQTIIMVDLEEMEVINTSELDFIPNELAAVDGRLAGEAEDHSEDEHDDDGHDHEEHDH